MPIYSMSVAADGFIVDSEGRFGWTEASAVSTDPSLRDNELRAAFADVWCALPNVVFGRTLDRVQGNARLAEAVS